MQRNVDKLTQLMAQLEILSRLRTPAPDSPDVQRVELESVAWEVARQLREMADLRGVDVQIVGPLPHVTIEVARLELILVNLLSNAIKYSDPTSPIASFESNAYQPSATGWRPLSSATTGIGIPPENLSLIFQRFVRAHVGRDTELGVRGSGLGLAIAAECVDAVGGSIRAESTVGVGTAFLVTLPCEAAAAQTSVQTDTL